MNLDLETILMLMTITFNTFLGATIFIHSDRKKSDISYIVLIASLVLWTISVMGIRLNYDYPTVFYFLALSHVAGLCIALSFWYFVETFIGRTVSYLKLSLALLPGILISILAFTSNKFTINILNLNNLNKDLVMGPFHLFFVAYFSLVMIYAFYLLYSVYQKRENHSITSAVLFVFWGTFITTMVGAAFNIYYLIIGISDYIAWGPVSTIIMVVFIAYAIMRLNLMSIKLIGSEIFVLVLLMTLAVKLVVSKTPTDWAINGISLFISVVVSIFLIRSVMKEIFQRERAEGLAKDLKKANEGQLNLMHFMNHQIKGRLGNAKNIFAELLTDDYGEVPEFAKPFLQKGLEETEMGVNYVQNILRGASAENGTLPYEMKPFDMKQVAEAVAEKQKDYAEKRNLKFSFEVAPGDYSMVGDSTQLSEAVKNLIDNSINYTREGHLDVTLKDLGRNIQFKVKDTGVGIDKNDMEKLFKSGGRGADSLKINVNSTGYGLAFVKGVVDAHKGRVWAESEGRDKGSVFTMELPKTL